MANAEEAEPEDGTAAAVPRCTEDLPPAARRALAEAAERRRRQQATAVQRQAEIGGRGGEDPARYGDWEIKGIAVDF